MSRLASEQGRPSVTGSDPSESVGDAALMRSALASLKENDREALMLIAWDGLDNARASAALGVTPQTFAVRLHRARRKLKQEITRLAQPAPPDDPPQEDR